MPLIKGIGNTEEKLVVLFGVWLPGQGWLKANGAAFCGDKEIAEQTARQWGGGARVRRIDPSLIILEARLLEREKSREWRWPNAVIRKR